MVWGMRGRQQAWHLMQLQAYGILLLLLPLLTEAAAAHSLQRGVRMLWVAWLRHPAGQLALQQMQSGASCIQVHRAVTKLLRLHNRHSNSSSSRQEPAQAQVLHSRRPRPSPRTACGCRCRYLLAQQMQHMQLLLAWGTCSPQTSFSGTAQQRQPTSIHSSSSSSHLSLQLAVVCTCRCLRCHQSPRGMVAAGHLPTQAQLLCHKQLQRLRRSQGTVSTCRCRRSRNRRQASSSSFLHCGFRRGCRHSSSSSSFLHCGYRRRCRRSSSSSSSRSGGPAALTALCQTSHSPCPSCACQHRGKCQHQQQQVWSPQPACRACRRKQVQAATAAAAAALARAPQVPVPSSGLVLTLGCLMVAATACLTVGQTCLGHGSAWMIPGTPCPALRHSQASCQMCLRTTLVCQTRQGVGKGGKGTRPMVPASSRAGWVSATSSSRCGTGASVGGAQHRAPVRRSSRWPPLRQQRATARAAGTAGAWLPTPSMNCRSCSRSRRSR